MFDDADFSEEDEAELKKAIELAERSRAWVVSEEAEGIRNDIQRLLSTYVKRQYEVAEQDDEPYIVGWAVGLEYTTIDLEKEHSADRTVITANHQPVSLSSGLGVYISKMFS